MAFAAVVELLFGVAAEGKSLESLAEPSYFVEPMAATPVISTDVYRG